MSAAARSARWSGRTTRSGRRARQVLLATIRNADARRLATCGDEAVRDPKRAVELATQACEQFRWKDPDALDTLAAAHADAGDFARALEYVDRAIELAGLGSQEHVNFLKHRQLFEAKKPLREVVEETSGKGP